MYKTPTASLSALRFEMAASSDWIHPGLGFLCQELI